MNQRFKLKLQRSIRYLEKNFLIGNFHGQVKMKSNSGLGLCPSTVILPTPSFSVHLRERAFRKVSSFWDLKNSKGLSVLDISSHGGLLGLACEKMGMNVSIYTEGSFAQEVVAENIRLWKSNAKLNLSDSLKKYDLVFADLFEIGNVPLSKLFKQVNGNGILLVYGYPPSYQKTLLRQSNQLQIGNLSFTHSDEHCLTVFLKK